MRRSSPAYSLLEVVIASAVFASMVIALIGVWALYHQAITKSRNMLVATSLARYGLESNLARGYANLTNSGPTQYPTVSKIRGRTITVVFTATFTFVDANPGFRHLISTVTWVEDTGPKSVTYDTYIYQSS